MFAPVSTDMTPTARELVGRVALAVQPFDRPLWIDGHRQCADQQAGVPLELGAVRPPGGGRHRVSDRARRVRSAPRHLSAAGYGEFHPRTENDSAETRARNWRVDVVILEGSL
jgi:hypothetical protein